MRPALVFIRHVDLGDRRFHHGEELPPGFLSDHAIDKLIDAGRLREYPERRSIFRLLHVFSACKEKEQLDENEIAQLALPP